MSYSEYVFYINNDRLSSIAKNGGWVCVADFQGLREDDLQHAMDMIDAPDCDSSNVDVIKSAVMHNKGVYLATGSTPFDAVKKVCETIDKARA